MSKGKFTFFPISYFQISSSYINPIFSKRYLLPPSDSSQKHHIHPSTRSCQFYLEVFLEIGIFSPFPLTTRVLAQAAIWAVVKYFLTCLPAVASSGVPLESILHAESKIIQMQIWPTWNPQWLHICLLGPSGVWVLKQTRSKTRGAGTARNCNTCLVIFISSSAVHRQRQKK